MPQSPDLPPNEGAQGQLVRRLADDLIAGQPVHFREYPAGTYKAVLAEVRDRLHLDAYALIAAYSPDTDEPATTTDPTYCDPALEAKLAAMLADIAAPRHLRHPNTPPWTATGTGDLEEGPPYRISVDPVGTDTPTLVYQFDPAWLAALAAALAPYLADLGRAGRP